MRFRRRALFLLPCCAALTAAMVLPVEASTFSIQYFEGTTGTVDFYNAGAVPIGVSNDYVLPTLGPDQLPLFNTAYTTASGTVNAPNPVYVNASGELLYWTAGAGPAGHPIMADGSGTITLSATPSSMFAPGTGGTNAVYEETAILKGTFSVGSGTTMVTFNAGADDTAFIYVDGALVESLGGIHSDTAANAAMLTYTAPGSHDVEIFYADHDVVDAKLSFTELQNNIVITPTPEPGTLLLFGTGLVAVGGVLRRKKRS